MTQTKDKNNVKKKSYPTKQEVESYNKSMWVSRLRYLGSACLNFSLLVLIGTHTWNNSLFAFIGALSCLKCASLSISGIQNFYESFRSKYNQL